MLEHTNWSWVRSWTQRIFAALFLLTTFAWLTGSPLLRPGGALATLPDALWVACLVAFPVSLAAGVALAVYSHRKGGDHSTR